MGFKLGQFYEVEAILRTEDNFTKLKQFLEDLTCIFFPETYVGYFINVCFLIGVWFWRNVKYEWGEN